MNTLYPLSIIDFMEILSPIADIANNKQYLLKLLKKGRIFIGIQPKLTMTHKIVNPTINDGIENKNLL
jgi:hypothetical protein